MPYSKKFSPTESAKLLLVDDNADLIKLMKMRLKPFKFELRTAGSAEEALSLLSYWTPNLIVTDLQLPNMSGMELFETVHANNPLLPVIVLTAHGTIPDAVAATQAGVATFLTKPFDGKELVHEIQSALLVNGFCRSSKPTHKAHSSAEFWRNRVVGTSPAIQSVFELIDRFAPTNSVLVFVGELGTGKSELARAAHARSTRSDKVLTHISCSSLPETLIEAEIYGKIGNGSESEPEQIGLLRQANGGTFLLNDFDRGSPAFLKKLLRATINKQAHAIDSDEPYSFDVRLMGTTKRRDAYDRSMERAWELNPELDVTLLSIPPLREHREDIPSIVQRCIENMGLDDNPQFSKKAMELLTSAEWPENIYQLNSVVRQCIRLCRTKVVSESLVNSRLNIPVARILPLTSAHREFERNYLTDVLKSTNGNVTRAAYISKRNRTEFHRLLKKHKIEAASFRQ